jgi:histidine triad (HIT) family protein
MVDCIFCARLGGADFWLTVLETPHSVAAVANHQRTPGSLIVVPRRHVLSLAELSAAESVDFLRTTRRACAAVERAYDPDGLYVWQGGRIPLPHVHLRICPRFADLPYSFAPNSALALTPLVERERIARRLVAALPAVAG